MVFPQNLLSMDNRVFAAFAFYASVLIIKIFLVAFSTVFYRLKNQVLPSEEDYPKDPKHEKPNVIKTHPYVERSRRVHQNDLENILPFILLGFLYVVTNPPVQTAILVFRIFTAVRVTHSITYSFALPSPIRGLSFLAGMACNMYLAINILLATKHAM